MIIKKKKIIWLEQMSKYSTKFFTILNNSTTRKELLLFCRKNNVNNHIISTLESDKEIEINLGNFFYKRCKDPNDIMYWTGRFKDDNISKLKKTKPIIGEVPKLISRSLLLRKISYLRYKFLNKNPNLNYYLIDIQIRGEDNIKNIEFRLDPDSDEWFHKNRTILNSGPSCI